MITVSSPFVVKLLEMINWIDDNITQIGIWTSVILTIIIAVGHLCRMIWQNRINRQDSRNKDLELKKKDLEIEELNLKVRLLSLEVQEKEKEFKDNNNK